jgi:hypothetical protein
MEKRSSITYPFTIDPYSFIAQNAGTLSLLNSNDESGSFLLAWGKEAELKVSKAKGAFSALKEFQTLHKDWMMGYLVTFLCSYLSYSYY